MRQFGVLLCLLFGLAQLSYGDPLTYRGLGAARCVSGSMHRISLDGRTYLVDAGGFYGDDQDSQPTLTPEDIRDVRAIFLTHAHLDHVGRLPTVLRHGYEGPIYCTEVTRLLLPIMLQMALRYSDLGQEQFVYSARSLATAQGRNTLAPAHPTHLDCDGRAQIAPGNYRTVTTTRDRLEAHGLRICNICLENEIADTLDAVTAVQPEEPLVLGDHTATFTLTPHIPGAAMVLLQAPGVRLLAAGDIGSGTSPFLPPQGPVPDAEIALIEGTYSPNGRAAEPRIEFHNQLHDAIAAGKRVIITAFALDRAQQVLYEIGAAQRGDPLLRNTPVTLVSPSAQAISELYGTEFTRPELGLYFTSVLTGQDRPLGNYGEARSLEEATPGSITVCTSGMADFAAASESLNRWVEDDRTQFFFSGYLDPESKGGMAFEQRTGDRMTRLGCFSAHAKPEQILTMLKGMPSLSRVLIVHSDVDAIDELAQFYRRSLPGKQVLVPAPGEMLELSLPPH